MRTRRVAVRRGSQSPQSAASDRHKLNFLRPKAPTRTRLPRIEVLETRQVLSADMWLVRIDGLQGDTRQQQIVEAQDLLRAARLDDQIQVVDHVGVNGIFVV